MYDDCARRAPPPPFEPFEPSEPSEPSRRRRVQWHSRIGGGERSEPITRVLIMPYDTESQSRNADFISIARRAIHNPRAKGPVKLKNLKNLRDEVPSTLTPKVCPMLPANIVISSGAACRHGRQMGIAPMIL